MKRFIVSWKFALVLPVLLFAQPRSEPPATAAAAGPVREHDVKAVFLLNFARFVEWPDRAFAATNAPVVIGILGNDPFGAVLDQAVAGETIGGRPLVIRRGQRLADVQPCHVLFVCQSETPRLGAILPAAQAGNALTVGETEAFARAGGIIRFITEGNRVRFTINAEAAGKAQLRVSAKLLKLAQSPAKPKAPER